MLQHLRRAAYTKLHGLSLTRRLVTVLVLLVLAAYLLTTSVTMTMLRGYLVDRVDADLETYINPLAQRVSAQLLEEATGQQSTSAELWLPPNSYYILYTPNDPSARTVPLASRGMQDTPDLHRVTTHDERLGTPFTVGSTEGVGTWRVLALPMNEGQEVVSGTIAVALPLDEVDSTVRQLAFLTFVIGLTTMVLVGVLGWFAVRRAFRPLSRMEDTAAAIAAGDLTRRIPPPGARDEVGSLSESLNAMLAHIEHSFAVREASEQRMRDFVADASHELRTPLATVKGYAELHRFGAMSDPEDVAGAMRRIEDEATRMTRLVEDLLTLTRWDSQPEMAPTRVDLTVLASDVVQDARVRAPERSVRLVPLPGTDPDSVPVVVGEDGALRQVLTNLVANALAHTPAGTPVEVAVGRVGEQVVVEVRDHGQGLSEDTADRVFERFYRADKSRSRASGGTGLGLAIVAAIVGRHQGSVRHTPTRGGGATFRVELPAPARPANS
ncbi:Osmosensitive K+ channel histidine kinase KdpD [Serinicoccus hydrothermalis]|uniref:histidine kinase n=1 Tax=Serinicoccus hydrothermalis TaxID=1758689 RepID=A0A1B1NFD4_9MICO|nr:HAMP domain-containing sensor histidine kinase [Serinicoccus hydrothermalis]ANS80152.1 Osmosensitive K+ channel histidine kinase KdpD [Serinicoccus hydrothermalis]